MTVETPISSLANRSNTYRTRTFTSFEVIPDTAAAVRPFSGKQCSITRSSVEDGEALLKSLTGDVARGGNLGASPGTRKDSRVISIPDVTPGMKPSGEIAVGAGGNVLSLDVTAAINEQSLAQILNTTGGSSSIEIDNPVVPVERGNLSTGDRQGETVDPLTVVKKWP